MTELFRDFLCLKDAEFTFLAVCCYIRLLFRKNLLNNAVFFLFWVINYSYFRA